MRKIDSRRTPRSRRSSPRENGSQNSLREDESLIKKRKISMRKIQSNAMRGKIISVSAKTLREIRRLQRTTRCLIPKRPFSRLMREIVQAEWGDHIRFQAAAMRCLQEAAEVEISLWFTKLNYVAGHAKRVTVSVPDSHLMTMLDRIQCNI